MKPDMPTMKTPAALQTVNLEPGAVQIVKRPHAPLAPSKAHRWIPCPGSVHVHSEDPETEWAAEGTRKHAVLKLVLTNHPVLAGDIIDTEAGKYTVPIEVLEQCHEVKAFIEDFKATHADGWVVETETRVEIGSHVWKLPKGECAGTADAVAYSFEELLVLDAKFGFVQVHPRGNPQLMLYALGLLAEIPFPIKYVVLCIAQPGYDGVVEFREHRLTADDLYAWAFDTQAVIEEIRAGSHRLHADDHACRYCPARLACPARMKALDDAMHEDWLQERSLEELLPVLPRLKAICKDIEQRAMADMSQGKEVRGFKLVAAKSRRKWKDEKEAEDFFTAKMAETNRPKEAIYQSPKLLSPAQMEKAIRGGATKKMTVKEAQDIVNSQAYQPQGGPKLVAAGDPRPALEAATWTLEDVLKASLEAGDDE